MSSKIAIAAIAAVLIGGVVLTVTKSNTSGGAPGHSTPQSAAFAPSNVALPAFNLTEKRGEAAFNTNCAQCHGEKATGTQQGPPFLHVVYKAGHHGDQSFFFAAQNGVRAHHWPYGDMPPQPHVSAGDLKAIVTYIRALQQANGFGS